MNGSWGFSPPLLRLQVNKECEASEAAPPAAIELLGDNLSLRINWHKSHFQEYYLKFEESKCHWLTLAVSCQAVQRLCPSSSSCPEIRAVALRFFVLIRSTVTRVSWERDYNQDYRLACPKCDWVTQPQMRCQITTLISIITSPIALQVLLLLFLSLRNVLCPSLHDLQVTPVNFASGMYS